ncbi:MAG: hypothetical protein ACO27E_00555 [Burkholderiaceae bacterium]
MVTKKLVTLKIHPAAPPKPREGQTCNGCGVCCLAEPCPMGALLTLRTHGPCQWLEWHGSSRTYRCGVLAATDPSKLPPDAGSLRRWWQSRLHGAARRWIAAGIGCDCSMDDAPADPAAT